MDIQEFSYQGSPAKIIFGRGALNRLAEVIDALGCQRALVLSTPQQAADAERLSGSLGPLSAGVFAKAAMHTPVETTEEALQAMHSNGADCTVAFGGGSTVGLGKAIAYRLDIPQIAIPTTYAGSEATPILGQTQDGEKTTLRDGAVLPGAVIYDPELSQGLPYAMSVTSGLNAMAHAAEALYAKDRNPVSTLMAMEGLRAFTEALPVLKEAPQDLAARSSALYGAWLCGTVLGQVGMSLHHKLCHVLGGSFDLPHAETHAIVLPHAIRFNEAAAGAELTPLADMLERASAGEGLYDFVKELGAPLALRDIGMTEADLDRAAEIATRNAYWNPRGIDRDGIRALLDAAWRGERPQG
ncbi:maleylacetate reductase [Sulfitobacter pseudonitzschiae]|uniref:Maleylacetate reductase n=1 Tax=Pseudosulfitobacter pseudonitzschiae TaxID=1402135 RepID=A0A9Q2NS50_9RHOB|nr:maleylacetate reductase [Pseudosulfitobacter pseudonitzschiae]MBM2294504.1 maleylacetate reductase [Pseudosulfitobacter pseudonitzschiae]MBM2299472.1 maleylacetate reductase [Pseudosulfitobacter pseudonitzschiae]MBM2304336.1 maleylacetate reductase [Pseudosulfitobacter pseudonitzschiae]MBM2314116.1 maleylacetate reductase [Pseudosulfitobacter pseudonitzschiae]MBM2319031.1 maleylacetate reductase [Pseudosulfitobacter pseudonitzschiae]